MAAPKVVLITGANSGIGYEAVKIFLDAVKPYHILLGARSKEKAESAVKSVRKECPDVKNTVEPVIIDASPGRLDALINNAGATFDLEFVAGRIGLRDCFNKAYDVNVTGAHVTSWTFMPLLLKSPDPRLIFVSGLSAMTVVNEGPYFPTPPQPAGWPKEIEFETIGYRCSKTALNMLTLDWSHKLKADGVKVWGVGPGMLVTNLGSARELAEKMGAGHASEGGKLFKKVIEGERDHQAGKVINKDGLSSL